MATFQVTNITAGNISVCAETVAAGATNNVEVAVLYQRPAEAQRLADLVNDGDIVISLPTYSSDRVSLEEYQATEWLFNRLYDASQGPQLTGLNTDGILADGGTMALSGTNLLHGSQTFDTLTLGITTAAVQFNAMTPGDSGISVVITQGAGALAVTYAASLLTVELAVGGSTSDEVATAVNAADSQAKGIVRCTGAGGGTVLVAASTVMAGGFGTYSRNIVTVGGVACLPLHATGTAPAATWTATSISVTVPASSISNDSMPVIAQVNAQPTNMLTYGAGTANTDGPALDMVDGTQVASGGGNIVLVGRNLNQGQTFDELVLWATTSAVTITAMVPGDSGYTIQITDGATAGAEVVTKTGDAFVIQIQAATSSANQIATAINADSADSEGLLMAVSGGAGTTNAIAAVAPMTGGVGDYDNNDVMVGGLAAEMVNTTGATGVAAWTDTSITVTTQAVGATSDAVAVEVTSNNVKTGTVTSIAT
jgi:hypothetical protein